MGKEDYRLREAKRSYESAKEVDNRREEARWANVIGDIHKSRGEYVKALKWLRIDYEISSVHLPEKDLLPTCQSMGEMHLRLEHFRDALHYQKEHLQLAKDANDLIEQQRACTQLGRTYHEIFMKSENDQSAVQNAKKYFNSAMELAQSLKENPSSNALFLKAYIDAHNNIGMLEMDLDNLKEAENILSKGLQICDEEEVHENDDARSRLHHNLGYVYTELRMWNEAHEHIKKDILICSHIGHCQGEAKGFINLGELYYRVQKYEDAIRSYEKALNLAKRMEDEEALAKQIKENIKIVHQAVQVMQEIKKEEQNLKKFKRNVATAKGTSRERKLLRQQLGLVDSLIDKAIAICAWPKHLEFAMMKMQTARDLCDKEKMSDSYLVTGESYQKLRNFEESLKWYTKSWETYKLIGNLEGQALAKINIGDVLDATGDWKGALKAFEEGYRFAVEANLPHRQISALENMHYSHMIRFGNVEEARRLQLQINNLKKLNDSEAKAENATRDCCPETDTEGSGYISDNGSDASVSSLKTKMPSIEKPIHTMESSDDEPLITLIQSRKRTSKQKINHKEKFCKIYRTSEDEESLKSSSRSTADPQTSISRNRARLVISDEDDELCNEVKILEGRLHLSPAEVIATSNEVKEKNVPATLTDEYQDGSRYASKGASSSCTPVKHESISSYKSTSLNGTAPDSADESFIKVRIEEITVCIKLERKLVANEASIDFLKIQAACLYYLQLTRVKRSNGLLPVIGHLLCEGRAIEAINNVVQREGFVDASISGWVQKRLIKLYVDRCTELSETPKMKVLEKLYNLEVSEDEVGVSECKLEDISIVPLLDALEAQKTIASLDLSHNRLGNGTMEKLKQIFTSSDNKYGGFTLDVHCNVFGPTALFQICECPVLLSRLEVLNISGNRLTDACGSHLSAILSQCKALYSLNIERCSITTRTIQKLSDALQSDSVLSHLSIGNNNPISGNCLANLLAKLSKLETFSELNLNGLRINSSTIQSICQFAKSSCLTALMLGSTHIGCEGASQVTESLVFGMQDLLKLDLSCCGLTFKYFERIKPHASAFGRIIELNLGGNSITVEGGKALASIVMNCSCCIKTLILNKCCLSLAGVVQIIKSLEGNNSLEELNLADNIKEEEIQPFKHSNLSSGDALAATEAQQTPQIDKANINPSNEIEMGEKDQCLEDSTFCDNLEVADSDDDVEGRITWEHMSTQRDKCNTSQLPLSVESSLKTHAVQELTIGIRNAKHLRLLDLSENGFSSDMVDMLYAAWTCNPRDGSPYKHCKDQVVHLATHGRICCGIKPCCRRD